MSNPINFNTKENQYYIWVSYWGIKVMKYFETPDDVLSYISAYPNRCMEIKKPINNETLQTWKAELLKNITPIKEVETLENEKSSPKKTTSLWAYFFIFLAILLINLFLSPKAAIVTLVSSITQAVGLLVIVFIFNGIKKSFKHEK